MINKNIKKINMGVNFDLQNYCSLFRHQNYDLRIRKREEIWVACFKINHILTL